MARQQGPDGQWHWTDDYPQPPGSRYGPPAAGDTGAGAPTKRRRRWPWIVGGVFGGLVLIGALAPKQPVDAPAAPLAETTAPSSTTQPAPTKTTTVSRAPTTTTTVTTLPSTTTTTLALPTTAVVVTTTESPYVPPVTTEPPYVPPATTEPTYVPPVAVPTPDPGGSVYFSSCAAAKAAGAAPLYRGSAGYRSGLDRDGDGVACET